MQWLQDNACKCADLGLSLLRQIMNAQTVEAEAAILKLHIFKGKVSTNYTHRAWISARLLRHDVDRAIFNPNVQYIRQRPQQQAVFETEEKGPNAAMIWGLSIDVFNWTDRDLLLSWGYVMWDKDRLNGWGLFKQSAKVMAKAEEEHKKWLKIRNQQ
jgi:hypothetical protein